MTPPELPSRARIKRLSARAIGRSRLLHRIAGSASQIVGAPATYELVRSAREFVTDGHSAARALLPGSESFAGEYAAVRADIAARLDQKAAILIDFAVGAATSEWLYCVVRSLRPTTVLEVGVAEGFSTVAILAALDANGHGRLISADIVPGVGGLVKAHPRWDLRIHDPGSSLERLTALVAELGEIDLFFHDAGHHYLEQADDYRAGLRNLREGGVFISDDVDFSWAFLELCRQRDIRPIVLGEGTKEAGGFVK